jgi:hypothetical protein
MTPPDIGDLRELIGRIDERTENTQRTLMEMKERMEKGDKRFTEINARVDNVERRVWVLWGGATTLFGIVVMWLKSRIGAG